jgi:hypothetical protein
MLCVQHLETSKKDVRTNNGSVNVPVCGMRRVIITCSAPCCTACRSFNDAMVQAWRRREQNLEAKSSAKLRPRLTRPFGLHHVHLERQTLGSVAPGRGSGLMTREFISNNTQRLRSPASPSGRRARACDAQPTRQR